MTSLLPYCHANILQFLLLRPLLRCTNPSMCTHDEESHHGENSIGFHIALYRQEYFLSFRQQCPPFWLWCIGRNGQHLRIFVFRGIRERCLKRKLHSNHPRCVGSPRSKSVNKTCKRKPHEESLIS